MPETKLIKDHHLWTRDTIKNVSGDVTLDIDGDLAISADGGNITMDDATDTIFDFQVDNKLLKLIHGSNTDDYFYMGISSNGATTLATVDGAAANGHLNIVPDGNLLLNPGANGYIQMTGTYLALVPATKTASGTNDFSFTMVETLNLASGEAGGSDVHYGIKYQQIQTDIAGWDSVYLMHLTGGSGKIFAVDGNGSLILSNDRKVIFGNAGEYIAGDGTDLDIVSSNDATISSGGDIILDSGGAINIEPVSGSAILLDGTISVDAGIITGATSITSTAFVGALTGNASGTAATVTGAAQTNITSLGTLTTLTVDDITIDGSTISDSGDFTIDIGGDIILDADGDQVTMKFGGAAGQIDFTNANSGDGIIQQKVDAKDLVIQQFDGDEVIRFTDGGDVKVTNTVYFAAETANTIGNGATGTIDWNVSQKQKVTITGTNITCNFTNPAGACNLLLKVVQGDGSDVIATWDGDIKWPTNDTVPTLSTGNGDIYIISFYFDGTNYFGVASLDFA